MAKSKKNNICVIGCGRFGSAIVDELIQQDKSVMIIDQNDKTMAKYQSQSLVTTFILDASDINTLQSIGIDEIETVIVATPDNIEIVAVLLELNIEHIIARASSSRHARVLKQIGVDMIVRPEIETGIRTALIATNSNFIKFSKTLTELGNGFVIGSSQILNSKYINIELKDLKFNKLGVSLVLVKRGYETFMPLANTKFSLGDELTVAGKVSSITKFFGLINENDTTLEQSLPNSTRRRRRKVS